MDWQCNIDKRGRLFRGIFGFLLVAAGVVLLIRGEYDFWAIGLCVLGAFMLFEGIKGWCAIRALGINTPL